MSKPVLSQRPENWDQMTQAEQDDWLDGLLDLMGFTESSEPEDPTSPSGK